MRRRIITGLAALGATAALVVASVAQAAPSATTINGTVGPGFTITINKKSVKAGKVTFKIQDKSNIHNFHITGPGGVNKSTTVSFTGTKTWTLTLRKGTYTIVCDPHASTMKTTLKVT
jgi:plastocyanin